MGIERLALAAAKETPNIAAKVFEELGGELRLPSAIGTTAKRIQIQSGGELRSYDLYVPDGRRGPMPAMMVLDGVNGETVGNMAKQSLMHEAGAREGFAVIYPYAGKNKFLGSKVNSWTTDDPNFGLTNPATRRDDIQFLKDVMGDVSKRVDLNNQAIHGAGFSEGGWLVQEAQQRTGLFTGGISSIHGTTTRRTFDALNADTNLAKPTDVLIVMGENDKMLPPGGGRGLMTALMPRAKESEPMLQAPLWNKINGSERMPQIERTPVFEHTSWVSQDGKHEVNQYMLRGRDAMHAWHGSAFGWPLVGKPLAADKFSATEKIVEHFKRAIERGEQPIARDLIAAAK